LRYDFRKKIRVAKEALSRDPYFAIALPGRLGELMVRQDELWTLILPEVERSIDIFEQAVAGAGLKREDLAAVYLTGGSSEIPLVATRLAERLGFQVVRVKDPKGTVALGAAEWAAGLASTTQPAATARNTPTPPVSDTPREPSPKGRSGGRSVQPPADDGIHASLPTSISGDAPPARLIQPARTLVGAVEKLFYEGRSSLYWCPALKTEGDRVYAICKADDKTLLRAIRTVDGKLDGELALDSILCYDIQVSRSWVAILLQKKGWHGLIVTDRNLTQQRQYPLDFVVQDFALAEECIWLRYESGPRQIRSGFLDTVTTAKVRFRRIALHEKALEQDFDGMEEVVKETQEKNSSVYLLDSSAGEAVTVVTVFENALLKKRRTTGFLWHLPGDRQPSSQRIADDHLVQQVVRYEDRLLMSTFHKGEYAFHDGQFWLHIASNAVLKVADRARWICTKRHGAFAASSRPLTMHSEAATTIHRLQSSLQLKPVFTVNRRMLGLDADLWTEDRDGIWFGLGSAQPNEPTRRAAGDFFPLLIHLAPDGRVLHEIQTKSECHPILATDKWLYCAGRVNMFSDSKARLVRIPIP
jgi:hypothetical protein